MKLLTSLSVLVLALAAAGSRAQIESRPVPALNNYMQSCMNNSSGGQPSASPAERALSTALCKCMHSRFPKKATMTQAEYDKASDSCFGDANKNSRAFTLKYAGQTGEYDPRDDALYKLGKFQAAATPQCRALAQTYLRAAAEYEAVLNRGRRDIAMEGYRSLASIMLNADMAYGGRCLK